MDKCRGLLLLLCGIVIGRLLGVYLFSRSPVVESPVHRQIQEVPIYYKENHTEPGNMAEAERVARRTSVFCLILTDESRHKSDLEELNHAWIKRCNDRILVSNVSDSKYPTVDGGQDETGRLAAGLGHIVDQYLDNFDWFLLATDRTFVIMENLRHFLDGMDPEEEAYYGERYWLQGGDTYALQLEPGAVVSRAALTKLATVMGDDACWSSDPLPGAALEECFAAAAVPFKWARDEEQKILFSYYEPLYHNWNGSLDAGHLSDRLVAFRLAHRRPWTYEKFIYHVEAFGTNGIVKNR